MFLKHKPTGNLIEVIHFHDVWDPCQTQVIGRFHAGEELQDSETFTKADLCFPSGEELPLCWLDPAYRLTKHYPVTAIAGAI